MFRALLWPSSGARDCVIDYHIGGFVLCFAVCWRLVAGKLEWCPGCGPDTSPAQLHLTSNIQQNKERNHQCGNLQHSRELLMMGIVMPETCCVYMKYNKIRSGIKLSFFYSSIIWRCLVNFRSKPLYPQVITPVSI